MKRLFIYKGLESEANINGYATYELKIGEFKPEYAGKMNYYLSLLDRLERREGENRSIGIILCAEKDRGDRTGIGRYGQTHWCSRLSVNYTTGRTKESRGRRREAFDKEFPLRTETEVKSLLEKL